MPGQKVYRVPQDPLRAQDWRTQRPEMPEDLWQPLYDRVNVATTVPSNVAFFSVPKGQSATLITGTSAGTKSKTYRDTNLESAGVSPTKMYNIIGCSLTIVHGSKTNATNQADRELLLEGGYLHVRIVDKDILFLPLTQLPLVNPIQSVATTANATSMIATNPGGGSGIFMYRLPLKATINPYENFLVEMVFDGTITLTNTLDVQFTFQSFLRRPT